MEPIKLERETVVLKFAHLAPNVWEKLHEIKRTGWKDHHVAHPESVQEHTIRLRELAVEIANDLEDFSTTDKDNLLDMLEIHDWAEAIDGDEAIVTNDEEDRKKRLTVKYEREYNTKIFELWIRFENSDDKIALLARQLDKFQAIEKALEYEHAQGIPQHQPPSPS